MRKAAPPDHKMTLREQKRGTSLMERTYSTLEIARRLGVSVQTVQRWVDIGRLKAWKTLGGHRRIAADDAEALFRASAESRAEPAPSKVANERALVVLVVDDDELDREFAVNAVRNAIPLAVVTAAANGFEALVATGREAYDVLIADLRMSHMNGVEMLRHLASQGAHRPRLMFASSSHSAEDLALLGPLPTDVVLMRKPIDPVALAERIKLELSTSSSSA